MTIKVNEYLEVCRTGKLNQFYTLYIYRNMVNDSFSLQSRTFIQNLALEENKAWDTAHEFLDHRREVMSHAWGEKNYSASIELIDSPRTIYCNLVAFGYDWKKTEKGFITYPDREFWPIWKQHKSLLKDVGFNVFKADNGLFILFFRNCEEEVMAEAFQLLEDKKASQVITGNFMGEIKTRLKGLKVTVESVFEGFGAYGTYSMVTFKTKAGEALKTKYNGPGKLLAGSTITLAGTVTKHEVIDGQKVTIINRIAF